MSALSNLLSGDWPVEKIEGVLLRHPRKPLLPPMDSEPWRLAAANPLVRKLTEPLRTWAEAECAEPLPELTDELYASFCHTGIRLTFEAVYFERRRRLARAAVSLLLSDKNGVWRERLVASVTTKLEAIFDESSWALPAHVNWDNSDLSGKEPLQIDLFCAETANLMAEMLDVFGKVFSDSLKKRIRKRLQKSVFENFLSRNFHWMEVTHNWNAVCHQGVVGAALSQMDDPHELASMLVRMREKLPHFLEGFGPDGGCSEGPGYWGYGFGWFTVLNEQLESRTGGELSLFAHDEHIRAIALYGPCMALHNGHFVNFADGPATGGLNPAILSYLGESLAEPTCQAASLDGYRHLLTKGMDWKAERADVFKLFRLLLRFPADPGSAKVSPGRDCILPDLGVMVNCGLDEKGHLWEFAGKGGHNGEHHNHNDCGSFLLNINGTRFITEIGAPEYVHDYFGPKRYEFLAARSLGHSVPLINGVEQHVGAEFTSKILSYDREPDRVVFALDLTRCYPAEARCKKLMRRMVWRKTGELQVEDHFALEKPGLFESAIICESPCEITGGAILIRASGGTLLVHPGPQTDCTDVKSHTYRTKRGKEGFINRARFCPPPLSRQGIVSYTITFCSA